MRVFAVLSILLLIAGCSVPSQPAPSQPGSAPRVEVEGFNPDRAARAFISVVNRVEPVAESECRRQLPQTNCDFKIIVDDRPNLPPNAYQTVDRSGRPIIAFTLALIADARNVDEIAFILGHEAAHHIEEHIPKTQASARTGAEFLGTLAQLGGNDPSVVRTAARIGAVVGARRFSKEFELEADALGTVIAARAGYDPVLGSQFFNRIPDPGDVFLGSHPPNAERLAIVRKVAAGL